MKTQLASGWLKFGGECRVAACAVAAAWAFGASALADTASELLERGLYAEETKGDIDGAIQFYQQALEQAKAAQSSGAQAQFHLGVCLLKKNQRVEAHAAFEKLVKDYPDQKDLIARAHQLLPGGPIFLPPPWEDGELMLLEVKLASGFKVGVSAYLANLIDYNGAKAWRVGSRSAIGAQGLSQVETEPETFAPFHSHWQHDLLGDVEAVYKDGQVEFTTAGKPGTQKLEVNRTVYDNEEVIPGMRRLPLAPGYKTSMAIVSSLGGRVVIPLDIEVTGTETVQVPAGKFDCYKTELSIHQTFWYSTNASHLLVKFEVGGAVAELAEVRQRKPGERLNYNQAGAGVSFATPPDWLYYLPEGDNEFKVHVMLLDTETTAYANVNVRALDSLKPEVSASARAFAENRAAELTKMAKDFRLRPEGFLDRSLNGRAAVTFIGDYLEGNRKMVVQAALTISDANAGAVFVFCQEAQFERAKPAFDALLSSFLMP